MALSILGLEQAGFLPASSRTRRPGRGEGRTPADRRVTSYYNHFYSRTAVSTDPPPSYAIASRESKFAQSQPQVRQGSEDLPKYTCTVHKEGPMQMLLESCSPFMTIPMQDWRPVYVVMQGTALYIHKLKTTMVGKQQVVSAGRLLRVYTLQHAEAGLAPDITHTVVTPLSRLASLIPPMARRKAHDKDPSLFQMDRQYALRVRSELDQFVLTHSAEEQIMSWVNHISAGIDIAPAIDERSIPRQCTMPRRRRRHQRPVTLSDMNDERFIEQQRRLLSMYPSLTDNNSLMPPRAASMAQIPSRNASVACHPSRNASVMMGAGSDPDQEELDLSEIAEDSRPQSDVFEDAQRSASQAAIALLNAQPQSNFDEDGKWAPPHPRSLNQQWRYIRRCMPILLADTPRHSSVMINDGQYIRPNYKHETLDKWSLQPPTYEAHDFTKRAHSVIHTIVEACADSGLTADNCSAVSSRSGSSADMQRVDSTTTPADAIAIATIDTSSLNLDLKSFALEKNITLRPTQGTRREASKVSTTSTQPEAEAPVHRTIFGF
ncbi:hypothetical protein K461DRAFT_275026 [Myriangium duriaei CBS 260.36]|uniref:PH domain-containing protein n=1 Tax=Myriangium duriaei CBS 260.36 TaxID=1168546 RepID=A0A9P4MK68_9PEZI|nr:hypothetical protein K461DRAFT_275026 [Myriangium duriaei CBS 260.36]